MIRIFVMILIAGALLMVACDKKQATADDVLTAVDSLEQKLDWMNHRLAEESWKVFSGQTSDSLEFYVRLRDYVMSDGQVRSLLGRAGSLVKDDVDRRRLSLLKGILLPGSVESREKIRRLRDSLTTVLGSYLPTFSGERQRSDRLDVIVRTDADRTRREMAYRSANAIGEQISSEVEQLIRLRNQESRKAGYNNFFAMAFDLQAMDLSGYTRLLSRLDSLTAGPYREILDRLRAKNPTETVDLWDLAFEYAEASTEIDTYFPVEAQMSAVKAGLGEIGFDLDSLPIYARIGVSVDARPLAQTWMVDYPYDQRVIAEPGSGLTGQAMLLHAFGRSVHGALIDEETPAFRLIPGAWREGMGRFFASLATEGEWLAKYGNVPEAVAQKYETAREEMAIIELRKLLLQLRFEYEAYKVSQRDLNKVYWDLCEQTLMLPRHDDIKPWACETRFVTHPAQSPDLLLGEIIARQTLAYLKEANGAVIGTNETRAFLVQNYFRFGSRYDWSELLERGTGEALNPEFLFAGIRR